MCEVIYLGNELVQFRKVCLADAAPAHVRLDEAGARGMAARKLARQPDKTRDHRAQRRAAPRRSCAHAPVDAALQELEK